MNIADSLRDISVAALDLSRYVAVSPDTPVSATIEKMNAAARSCAFVVEDSELVGIFTQRDVVAKVVGVEGACGSPVASHMTPEPQVVAADSTVAEALARMAELWVRSLPVVQDDRVVGNLSYYTVMKLIAELLADRAGQQESEPSAQHGLMFVDFSGLRTDQPVTVAVDDRVESALHLMRARGLGSVLVVNERESLVGVLTEFDLQTKIACTADNPHSVTVGEVMEPHPVALSARAPIGEAVAGMAHHEMSHVALVADTGRPVGMATFQDVVDYFETTLETLG